MGFAGIWESWKTPNGLGLETFAILTTSANPLISTIHDRRPVILHPDAYSLWLDKDVKSPEQVNNRYGDFIVTFASLMDTEEKGSHVISPTWRPNGIRCVDMK